MPRDGNKKCPFNGVTSYGRSWRKGAGKRGLECATHPSLCSHINRIKYHISRTKYHICRTKYHISRTKYHISRIQYIAFFLSILCVFATDLRVLKMPCVLPFTVVWCIHVQPQTSFLWWDNNLESWILQSVSRPLPPRIHGCGWLMGPTPRLFPDKVGIRTRNFFPGSWQGMRGYSLTYSRL